MNCQICTNPLALETVVNTECGHSCCKDCFWRWTKDKNSCPYCRTNLLANSKELEELQHMRDLLAHRSEIVRDVEQAYHDQENIIHNLRRSERALVQMNKKISAAKARLTALEECPYRSLKHFEQLLEKNRLEVETSGEFVPESSVTVKRKDFDAKNNNTKNLQEIFLMCKSKSDGFDYKQILQIFREKKRDKALARVSSALDRGMSHSIPASPRTALAPSPPPSPRTAAAAAAFGRSPSSLRVQRRDNIGVTSNGRLIRVPIYQGAGPVLDSITFTVSPRVVAGRYHNTLSQTFANLLDTLVENADLD